MEEKGVIVLSDPSNIFVQSNDFIQAKYKDAISFWEMMIFGKMCTMIDINDTEFQEYKIYVKDLVNFAGLERNGRLYDTIIEAATKLRRREISVPFKDEFGKNWLLDTYLVTGVEKMVNYEGTENVYVALTIHPKLKPFLMQLKRDFTKFDINNYKFLHSGTITRLYQLLKSYHDRGRKTPKFDLMDLKEMLGISNKYDLYANFRIKVLDEAQKRFGGTDMRFTYDEVKQGKKVTGILFTISTEKSERLAEEAAIRLNELKSNNKPSTARENAVKSKSSGVEVTVFEALFPNVQSFGVTETGFMALVKTHDEERIRKAIRLTEKALLAGKIKGSAAGYFVEAVRSDYRDAHEEKAQKRANARAAVLPKKKEIPIAPSPKIEMQKQLFEQERAEVLGQLMTDATLHLRVLEKVRQSIFRDVYDNSKSFNENLQKPSFLAAVLNIVKNLKNEI